MKKSINFLALTLDVLSLLSLRGAIYSSILGAILFISCNANRENVVDAKNVVVWDSLTVFNISAADSSALGSDSVFTINPASYKFTVVDAFDTTPKKKHVKVSEQNVDLPLRENIKYPDAIYGQTSEPYTDVFILDSIGVVTPLYDTLKVVMLVSDTTADIRTGGYVLSSPKDPYIRNGYEVREIVTGNWVIDSETMDGKYEWYLEHIAYLDENKKPLSKNIIVWLSK